MAEHACDVLVVGGGPAGLALVLALRRHGSPLSVLVVERTSYELPGIGETLSPGARTLLEHLGVWEGFAADGHLAAYGTSAAWGSPELATRDFLFTPFGTGWHLDRRRFDARLADAAEAAGAPLWRRSRVRRLGGDAAGGFGVEIDRDGRPERVSARFLVDATGKGAVLARHLGGDRRVLDRQVALAATVAFEAEPPVETSTMVEAVELGWWYSAPIPGQQLVVALVTDADLAREHGLAREAAWHGQLEAAPHTSRRLAGGRLVAPPRVVAAHSACLVRTVGEGWLAVGDAAACHDPLSSSGIVRALDSGIRGARAIHAALVLGDREALPAFDLEQGRAFDQYCATRAAYYQIEGRWPDGDLWRRRQRQVILDPRALLAPNLLAALVPSRWPRALRLPADLRHLDARLLLELVPHPRPAHEVVAEHRQRATEPGSDLDVILGLQWLLARGVLRLDAPG
ncbi:MAG TPA: tryptophan 7-halogenase [Thermoanaerobaculia bacterium]|nr:tryptophan 7-halogenase [Thermoanaerobaculia bacterium]